MMESEKNILIRGALVPSLDERGTRDILVGGGRIVAIEPKLSVDAGEIIDATGMIAIPGLIDTHRHTWQNLLRGAAIDWSRGQYIAGVRGKMGPLYTPEDMRIANYTGALDALDSGVTTIVDWSHNNNSPEHADAAIQGLRDAGIRAVFAYGADNDSWRPISDRPADAEEARRLRGVLGSDDALITMAFAARGPEVATMQVAEAEFRLARELELRSTVHVGCGLWGGPKHAVTHMHERKLTGPDITYVHCCTCTSHELDLIADTGGTVSVSGPIELSMGHGNPPVLELLKRGIRPSLSVDTCMSVAGDLFSQMRQLLSTVRGFENERAAAARQIVDDLPLKATDLFDFATLQGARACGLEARIGSLETGKQADLALIDTRSPNLIGAGVSISTIVGFAHQGNVDTVIVAGKIRKRGGKLVGVDLEKTAGESARAREDLFRRAGVAADTEWKPDPYVNNEHRAVLV